MGDGQENRVGYPLIAIMCALVLVGGPIMAMMIWSANHTGKSGSDARRLADAAGSYSRTLRGQADASGSYSRTAIRGESETKSSTTTSRSDRSEESFQPSKKPTEREKDADMEEAREKEPVSKLEEPKKESEPVQEKETLPVVPPVPAKEKSADRNGSLSTKPLSAEEKMLEVIRAFIVRQLAHPDGFGIVDHTKPERVKAVNQKPAKVMRVVFRAQDGLGRAGPHDFLFVVQNDEVVEHAPTAVYVAAQRARQQAMLQVALLNEALLQQQLRGLAEASRGAGGGCVFKGG